MEKVNRLVREGLKIPTAIKAALEPMTVAEFAEKHGRPVKAVSNEINGNVRASTATIAGLVAELGGTEVEWRELLWLASKPQAATAAA